MNLLRLIKIYFFTDRKYRIPRIWSNKQLKKYAPFFTGKILNASAWEDKDKEGSYYRNYFINTDEYYYSNYKKEMRGFQGCKNEFFLDLEKKLDKSLINRFDVVLNHTTLEHIYHVKIAFKNLCLLTKDILILVVPFLQQMHAEYGDYWRFTPLTIKKMCKENNMTILYSSFNNHKRSSVYLFFIISKNPKKWKDKIFNKFNYKCKKSLLESFEDYTGCRAIINPWLYRISSALKILNNIIKSKIKKSD